MPPTPSPISALHDRYRRQSSTPVEEIQGCLAKSNTNRGHNVYLFQDPSVSNAEAAALPENSKAAAPLWGVPVSVKDCFDIAGVPTSCGSSFYRGSLGVPDRDSEVVRRLRDAGAVITGKTHLHQIAYGITGESRDFGDCVQPRNDQWLTGGSSSGAAASIQEGSALAAIGTDTGGSVRVPAALCGLAGYRSSVSLNTVELWRGGYHLAESFDTVGWLYRDLRDGPLLGSALLRFAIEPAPQISTLRIGLPHTEFFHDCDASVRETHQDWTSYLSGEGMALGEFDTSFWRDAVDIFAPIQASEASALHRGNFEHFEKPIADRLAWGASISASELANLQAKHRQFRSQMEQLLDNFDYLLFPCAPVSQLQAGADHSQTRARLLRYTAPVSLAGFPTVVLPGRHGALQLVGKMNSDGQLLALSAALADGPTY